MTEPRRVASVELDVKRKWNMPLDHPNEELPRLRELDSPPGRRGKSKCPWRRLFAGTGKRGRHRIEGEPITFADWHGFLPNVANGDRAALGLLESMLRSDAARAWRLFAALLADGNRTAWTLLDRLVQERLPAALNELRSRAEAGDPEAWQRLVSNSSGRDVYLAVLRKGPSEDRESWSRFKDQLKDGDAEAHRMLAFLLESLSINALVDRGAAMHQVQFLLAGHPAAWRLMPPLQKETVDRWNDFLRDDGLVAHLGDISSFSHALKAVAEHPSDETHDRFWRELAMGGDPLAAQLLRLFLRAEEPRAWMTLKKALADDVDGAVRFLIQAMERFCGEALTTCRSELRSALAAVRFSHSGWKSDDRFSVIYETAEKAMRRGSLGRLLPESRRLFAAYFKRILFRAATRLRRRRRRQLQAELLPQEGEEPEDRRANELLSEYMADEALSDRAWIVEHRPGRYRSSTHRRILDLAIELRDPTRLEDALGSIGGNDAVIAIGVEDVLRDLRAAKSRPRGGKQEKHQ
jgi:hypothetical protein